MQRSRRLAGALGLALLAATATAQDEGYGRDAAGIWRRSQGRLWRVDERSATVRLDDGDFARWRAGLPPGSLLRRLSPVRANRLGFVDVALPADVDALLVLELLRRDARVRSAELSARGSYAGVPNDPQFAQQWHLRNTGQLGGIPGADVGAVAAWDLSVGDPSVVLAFVDSGTQITHPDLAANVWLNSGEIPANGVDDDGNGFIDDLHGWDFENSNPDVSGTSSHGTQTTGTALARTNNLVGVSGLAGGFVAGDGCRGMILAVGNSAPLTALVDDAILYAADNGARVISMSLQVPTSPAIDAAIQYAHDVRGAALVAAAGNVASSVQYPANLPRVIAVGSSNTSDARSSFSAMGPELWCVAPGESIRTTTTGSAYAAPTGTSFSTPLVSATLGLLFTEMPSLSADDAREILKLSAADIDSPGFDVRTGWGRISAFGALDLLRHSDCDGNGIYDPSQIANGTSLDANGNGVPDECEIATYCTGAVNSLGCTPAISASGVPSASSTSGFTVTAVNVLNQRPGLLMYSLGGRAALPLGLGTLCLAGPVRRTVHVSSGGSPGLPDCSGVLAIDMNAFAHGLLGGARDVSLLAPGARVGCQWWSSDPLPGLPSNPSLSNALEYSIEP